MTQLAYSSAGTYLTFSIVGCHKRSDSAPATTSAPDLAAQKTEYFAAAEMATLAAACERLFPRDATPGAIDLGVPTYADRAFAAAERPPWHEAVRRGLVRLDRASQQRFKTAFHEIADEEQDTLLRELQQRGGKDTQFFNLLLATTLEGALGDPVHGGNRQQDGWKLIGFAADPCRPKSLKTLAAPPRRKS